MIKHFKNIVRYIPGFRVPPFRKGATVLFAKTRAIIRKTGITDIIRENINGILGTIVFHLLIVVIIMATRLSTIREEYEERVFIQFETNISEEEFRDLTESLMADGNDLREDAEGRLRRDIAVNVSEERPVPDDFKNMSESELSELEQRINEILQNAADGIMPELDQPEIEFELPTEIVRPENNEGEFYTGPTTITYDLPGRKHIRMPVPVYKCPDGGIAEVSITVNRIGRVINATINNSPSNFNEVCIYEMAIEAALGSRFSVSYDAPEVQNGTITFYFQKQ